MLYCYIKKPPKIVYHSSRELGKFRLLSLGLIIMGIGFLANVSLPIVIYQLKSSRFRQEIISPVNSYYVDYSKPSSWFPEAPKLSIRPSKITHYALSIPKLKIINATVEIGGDDLNQELIHYPGTALPGQYGNGVIFGHSVLPQFFNPKNYKTIFSPLPTLKEGDEVFVEFDGVIYRYVVIKMVEVAPSDITVLEQHYDGEYLSLITCVPPGTYLRRLVVKCKLVKPEI